jgi:Carboxypeptidase regulatory-like domain
MRQHPRLLLAAFLALVVSVPAYAQKITGTLRGSVTDPTGAIIPGAKVTVKNEDTGLTRSGTTTSAGIYSFAELPVGSYRVEVEHPGFKQEVRSRVILNVADTRAVDIQLATGDVSEVVNVEVAAVAVKTVGADVSGLVTGQEVRALPLNGRNFMQLTLLQPGVSAIDGLNTIDKGLGSGSDISVSGGSVTNNYWMVDGANNIDLGSGRTILVYPSVDAIEEFKIQRNNYGAEFGQAGGAQVNIVTRGGTNEFHGSGYWYGRRDGWNSTDFFLKEAGQEKAPLKWDDYGGTFGGPIIKNKLHFFASLEWNKDKRSDVRARFVPTAEERLGDFSGAGVPGCSEPAPIDPLTGQPFPGGIIPNDRLSPGGLLMMQLFSLPNTTPTGGSCNNWVEAVPTPVDWRQENFRVDWTVTNSTRLMVRWTHDSWEADRNQWGDDPFPIVRSLWNQPGKSLVAQLNQNIGSSMVNSLTFSYSANTITVVRAGDQDLVDQLNAAIPTLYPADIKQQGGQGQPAALWGSLGPYSDGTLWNQAPWLNNQDLFVVKDDWSAVFGAHFVKAGLLFSTNKKNEEPANTSQESVGVNGVAGFLGPNGFIPGANTGNTIANWVLEGMVWDTAEIKTNKPVLQRWKDYEFYIADTYKASSRVTADFGVRLSHFTLPFEANDEMGVFDPNTVNPAFGNSPCNGMLYPPGTNPCPALGLQGGGDGPNRSVTPIKSVMVAPRLGVAWDVFGTGKTAIRGGLGLFYARERLSAGLSLGLNPPFSGSTSLTRTLGSSEAVTGEVATGFGAPTAGIVQEAGNTHNWQWNIAVQHELRRNTVLEVAYVGNKGQDLLGVTNLDEIAPQNRLAYSQTGDPSLRPLNGIAGIGEANIALMTRDRDSMYHSLQAALTSRFGTGSILSLAYTLSKSTANTGLGNADSGLSERNVYTDSTNPELDRSRSAIDRRHMFSGSLVLALPKFEDKSSAMKNIFGDWEFSSIVQASSGYPYTIFVGGVPGLSSGGNLTGVGYGGVQRPDRVAGVPCQVEGGSKTQWFNPAAWTIDGHQIGTNGTAKRHDCDGPGYFRVDMALYKNIKVGGRVQLQLRAEMFNVFNRTNFLSADGNVQTSWNPQNVVFDTGDPTTATRVISAAPAGGFGQLNRAADPRQMQLGLKLMF